MLHKRRKVKKTFVYLTTTILNILCVTNGLPVASKIDCGDTTISEEVRSAAGCTQNSENAFRDSLTKILNSIIAVVGLVSVIFVIIGGINYMTSAGDAAKLEKAKKTILYALIGLIICALAFAIVNFVIGIIP